MLVFIQAKPNAPTRIRVKRETHSKSRVFRGLVSYSTRLYSTYSPSIYFSTTIITFHQDNHSVQRGIRVRQLQFLYCKYTITLKVIVMLTNVCENYVGTLHNVSVIMKFITSFVFTLIIFSILIDMFYNAHNILKNIF